MKTLSLALLAVLVLCASSSAAACLRYATEVTLRGKLSRQTFAEQPNYESIANGDRAATYFFISTPEPVCVATSHSAGEDPPARGLRIFQLVFASGLDGYGPLRPYVGKVVECRGVLFRAASGHHHSTVLLSEATCRAI